MSVSRRGFLQGLGAGRNRSAAEFMAARGHEEFVAEAMQQGRQGGRGSRPAVPPGMEMTPVGTMGNATVALVQASGE